MARGVKIHAPLDTGHQPFKRLAVLGGPGGRRKAIKAQFKYDCNKDGKYRQKCVVMQGKDTGRSFTVKTNPSTKAEYNRYYSQNRKRAAPSNDYRAGFKLKDTVEIYPEGQRSMRKMRTKTYTPGYFPRRGRS